MAYKITITQAREVRFIKPKEWVQVGDEEVERDERWYGDKDKEPKTRIKAVYGYSPEVETRKVEQRDVLVQEVDNLDLAAVIKAINGL